MTALTLTDAIQGLSNYTVGATGDMTSAQLTTFQALVAKDLVRLNPGFTGDELTRFEAYLVLDLFDNRPGTGFRTQEKIKDDAYTIRPPKSSSYWMDCALKMIEDYLQTTVDPDSDYVGVERDDADMTQYSDGSDDPYLNPLEL